MICTCELLYTNAIRLSVSWRSKLRSIRLQNVCIWDTGEFGVHVFLKISQ